MGSGSVVSCVVFDIGFASNRSRQSPIEGTASGLLEMTSSAISAAMLRRDGRGPCGTRYSSYGSPQITPILQDGRSDSLLCGWLGPQQAFDCEGLACDLWGDRCPSFEGVVPKPSSPGSNGLLL